MNWGIHPMSLKNEVMYVKENYGNPNMFSPKMDAPCRTSPTQMGL